MMNANKKNIMSGGWILCPSKTFPGKFYYFNVLNGEAAWSLGDAEKKIIKTIPKVQESHHHPEPSSPPTEPTIPKLRLQHPKPIFGQSVFPKVLPKPAPFENVIWTHIQTQVPIVVTPEKTDDSKSIPKAVKQKTVWDFNNDLFIPASSTPLSKRFVNFEDPVINLDKDNKIQNKMEFNEFYMSKTDKAKTVASNDIFQKKGLTSKTDKTYSHRASNDFSQKKGFNFSDLKPKKQLIKEAVFNIEVPSETPEVKQIESKVDSDKVDFGNMERQNNFGDLRNLLTAKKRKPQVNSEEVERKKLKTMESTTKKKVSFNLDHEDTEFDDYNNDMNFREKYSSTVEILRNLSGTVEEWCIVVDGEVLLDEFSFLNQLVQLDPHCKLVIPSTALSYVSAASRGTHATAARSVLRRLNTPYIIVQSDDVTGKSNDDKIKSCVDAMYRNTHVVLISKNIELLANAKCYPIHCYHISTIKNGLTPKPEYKQNMKITIRNTEANLMNNGPAENVLKDLNEREKETLKFTQNQVKIGNDCTTPVDTLNKNSIILIENSKILNNNSLFEQCSRNAKSNTLISNLIAPNPINLAMSSQKNNLQDSKTMYPINSQENSKTNSMKQTLMNSKFHSESQNKNNTIQDSNMNSLNHLFNTRKDVFNNMTKTDENKSKMLTDWRYAESDITETTVENTSKMLTDSRYAENDITEKTIEMDFQNLNLKDKYQNTHKKDKLNKNVSYFTHHSTPNINLSFNKRTPLFQNGFENVPDSNFEFQKSNCKTAMFQNNGPNVRDSNFEVQQSNFKSPIFPNACEKVPDSNYEVKKSNFKMAMFQNNGPNIQDSNFEVPKSNFNTPMFQNGGKNVQGSNYEVQKSNFKTAMFQNNGANVQDSNYKIQKSNYKTGMFQSGGENVHGSNFDVQKSNYETSLFQRGRNNVQGSNSEVQKSNFKSPIFPNSYENVQNSNFELQKSKEPQYENITEYEKDVFKKPNKPLNWTKRNNNIDLSNFYVKNKVMDSRLNERMDEFVCTYKQIMEEFLSSILEKLSPHAFKSMAPPWSLYEALQCAKNIYKDHIIMKNIIDQLSGFLYENECRKDKMKLVITPSEFMKAVGCGVHLIQYLKKILQPSPEILESEQNLIDMIKQIENPVYDINEPLVKTPVECNADYKEIRQNFVKNRTDIISYLKKHYPDWQNYEETDNTMKIFRTFGRNLNMLKLERVKEKTNTDVVMKNIDVGTNNTDSMKNVEKTNNIGNITSNGKVSSECTTFPTFKDRTKNVGVFVMKEVGTKNIETDERIKIVQEKSNINQNKTNLNSDSKMDRIDKPKTKSMFDFMIPKDKNQENRKEKFNIHNDILGVKITIPNKAISKDVIEKDARFESNQNFIKDIEKNKCVRKLNMNIQNDNEKNKEMNQNENIKAISKDVIEKDARFESNQNFNKDIEKNKCVRKLNMKIQNDNEKNKEMNENENIDKPKGIKIIRNIHLIEEFEKRLKNKAMLEFDNLDYSSISSNETNLHPNCNNNDQINKDQIDCGGNNHFPDHTNNLNAANKFNGQDVIKNHNDNYEDKTNHNENNDIKINEKQKESKENYSHNIDNRENYVNNPKNRKDDPKSDGNDSGLGNESPRIYSAVKSFSFGLNNSLEHIRTYIDGSLQEFRQGKLNEDTKKIFRFKAFETNFHITRIISRLNKLVQVEKINPKNVEVISKCLDQADILQKALIMILTVTNESSLVELNSSMSLNLS